MVRLVDVAQAQFGINQEWVDLIVGAVVLGVVLIGAIRQKIARVVEAAAAPPRYGHRQRTAVRAGRAA